MESFAYFAYGSNMLLKRLTDRCPSARLITAAALPGHILSFCKKSKDGSGKATLIASEQPGAEVYGAVYDISCDDLAALDRLEGRGQGYDRIEGLEVFALPTRQPIVVTTYIADPRALDGQLQPYDWYLELVVMGAKRVGLPDHYCRWLSGAPSRPDPEPTRATRLQALEILDKRGA